MGKLNTTVVLRSPEGDNVVLRAGDEAPEWADLGSHVLEGSAKPKSEKESSSDGVEEPKKTSRTRAKK